MEKRESTQEIFILYVLCALRFVVYYSLHKRRFLPPLPLPFLSSFLASFLASFLS
jgi:hypothetical protein